jgi:hypothetical protein
MSHRLNLERLVKVKVKVRAFGLSAVVPVFFKTWTRFNKWTKPKNRVEALIQAVLSRPPITYTLDYSFAQLLCVPLSASPPFNASVSANFKSENSI